MKQNINFNYIEAIKELFLDAKSDANRAFDAFFDNQRYYANRILEKSNSEFCAKLQPVFENPDTYASIMDVCAMLYQARKNTAAAWRYPSSVAINQFMLTFDRIPDESIKYEVLNKIIKEYNIDTQIGRTAIQMRAKNKYVTAEDLIDLVYVSAKEDQPAIFAEAEKLARAKIAKHLNQVRPNITAANDTINYLVYCAEKVFGPESDAYRKISQEYSPEKLLTPQVKQYIATMSDADKRAIQALTDENAKLREQIKALEAEKAAIKSYADKCKEDVTTLLQAIKHTRFCLFNPGAKEAKKQAKAVYKKLRDHAAPTK